MYRPFVFIALLMFVISCGGSANNVQNKDKDTTQAPSAGDKTVEHSSAVVEPAVIVPIFDADSAYHFIEKQLSFGPRVPGTDGHKACAEYLISKLKSYGADVVAQNADLKAYNGDILPSCNIIAQFQPDKQDRVLLFAHWDTRPWADSDPDESNHYKPIPGANDGGSGVGVLLEIARQLSAVPTTVGVDIIFFDAEDYGLHEQDVAKYYKNTTSWALGSQYWAMKPHKSGYDARFGILLDIVGAPGSRFLYEGYSMKYADRIVDKVWKRAASLGYSDFFVGEIGGMITDDHYYVNTMRGIPSINIINCDPDSPNGFGAYHHTMGDNMDWIDRAPLKAVGQTVLTVIYNEK